MSQAILIKGEGRYPTPEVRRIKPHKRLLWKYITTIVLLWVAILVIILGLTYILFTWLSFLPTSLEVRDIFILFFTGISSLFFIPILLFLPFYVNSMEYIVHGHEVVVKKGIFNKTIKYCPYRTVTNISTTAGPFDRFFGIGSVNIETAGKGGVDIEPVEKLEGLFLYQEIRDYILRRLRVYHSIQETETSFSELPTDRRTLQRESINTLREIRDLLKIKLG